MTNPIDPKDLLNQGWVHEPGGVFILSKVEVAIIYASLKDTEDKFRLLDPTTGAVAGALANRLLVEAVNQVHAIRDEQNKKEEGPDRT